MMVTINQELDVDTATLIAENSVQQEVKASKKEELFAEVEDKLEDLVGETSHRHHYGTC